MRLWEKLLYPIGYRLLGTFHLAKRKSSQIESALGPVSKFVRSRRAKLGYTQEELAQRVGVGLRFIRELETGKATLRMDKVNQVLNYFGAELAPQPLSRES
jgi:y4mF family transcriptional regulator